MCCRCYCFGRARCLLFLTHLENRQFKNNNQHTRISEMKGMDTHQKHAHTTIMISKLHKAKKKRRPSNIHTGQHAQLLKWRHSLARTIWNRFFFCFEFSIYAWYAFVLAIYAKQELKTQYPEWMNEWMTVGWTNESWINHLLNWTKNTFYSSTILFSTDFHWTQAYQLECTFRTMIHFFPFLVSIQRKNSPNELIKYIVITASGYIYMLWIIVELFALFSILSQK